MARLVACPVCSLHIHAHEQQCPHCGAPQRSVAAPRASAILLGLTLAGCPADDDDDTAGSANTTASTSDTGTSTATSSGSSVTDDSISGSGGVEYGTADSFDVTTATATDTATDPTIDPTTTSTDGSTGSTGADSSSGSSDTVGEPEYGVTETTG